MRFRYPDAKKHVFDVIDAYSSKLNDVNISIEKAIELIHGAGGKAVWAHPFCVYKDFRKISMGRQEIEIAVKHLKAMGLDGLEAYYAAFDEDDRTWLHTLTCQEDLIYTAGSDFHGSSGRSLLGVEIAP